MNKDNQEKLNGIYTTYNTSIKYLLALIETYRGCFPIELFNEIRALFDHIARCYLEDINEEEIALQLNKAESHVFRIILDSYKHLIIYCDDRLEKFEKETKSIDLTSIDNGQFSRQYEMLYKKSKKLIKEAKIQESKDKNYINKIVNYETAYNSYVELLDLIFEAKTKIDWARVKYKAFTFWRILINIIIWLIGILIGSIITNNNLEIVNAFKNIIS